MRAGSGRPASIMRLRTATPLAARALLAGQLGGMEVVAKDTLTPCHGGFRFGPLAVIGLLRPALPSLLGDGPDVPISSGRLSG